MAYTVFSISLIVLLITIWQYRNDCSLSQMNLKYMQVSFSTLSSFLKYPLSSKRWKALIVGRDKLVTIGERRAESAISFRDTRVSHSACCCASLLSRVEKIVERRRLLFTPARVRSSFYKVIKGRVSSGDLSRAQEWREASLESGPGHASQHANQLSLAAYIRRA